MPKIRLAMLVYGEDTEPIIERTKSYVYDVVTHSESYTEGMATLRNRLLEKAREGLGPNDYLLLLDPDEIPSDTFPDVELTADCYSVTYRGGGEAWEKSTLLRVGAYGVFYRSVHEYLETENDAVHLDGYEVEQPFSSSSRERQEWKVRQLLSELDDPRSVYYLAQTYECLGLKGEAMRWYMERSTMGGFLEEQWHALYKAACLAEVFDYRVAMDLFDRARILRPTRAESYYRLARLQDFFGLDDEAWRSIQFGAALPASRDVLFVSRWTEEQLQLRRHLPVGHVFDEIDDDEWSRAMKGLGLGEGVIGDDQVAWLGDFVRDLGPITVAETGFGLGRSAWTILEANDEAQIVSFDLGEHEAVEHAHRRLCERFPHRTVLVIGDSKETVPVQTAHDYDLVIIDGGHDYDTASADIGNFAHPGRTVIFDDLVSQPWATGCVRAWSEALEAGLVIEKERHGDGLHHTWAVGEYR